MTTYSLLKYQCLLISLFLCCSLIAQDDGFSINIQQFTEEDGLSSKYINAVTKDSRGIIWVATQNGLNRFDGKYFKVFTTENGLLQNNVSSIQGEGDVLWCIYDNENIRSGYKDFSLFHTLKEKSISLEEHMGTNLPFSKTDISYIEINRNNQLIVITLKDKSIYIYTNGGLQLVPNLKSENIVLKLDDGYIVSKEGHDAYVRKIDVNGKELYKIPFSTKENYKYTFITYQDTSPEGDIWLSYWKNNKVLLKITKDGIISKKKLNKSFLESVDIPILLNHYHDYPMTYLSARI